jgi:hypothetical protein
MNNPRPIDLNDPKTRSSSVRPSRKLVIGLLVALIVSAMISWTVFLGWGVVEIMRVVVIWTGSLWARFF